MSALLIMVLSFAGYILMYRWYGRFIGNKIFKLSDSTATPAVNLEDGIDYVPTKKEVIFGHHFTSIAGTGPIVGPAIAIIWGWGAGTVVDFYRQCRHGARYMISAP